MHTTVLLKHWDTNHQGWDAECPSQWKAEASSVFQSLCPMDEINMETNFKMYKYDFKKKGDWVFHNMKHRWDFLAMVQNELVDYTRGVEVTVKVL